MGQASAEGASSSRGRRHALVLLGLLALVGANMRTVMLGVPPVLPLIQRDLGLSHVETGLVTSLPVLMMGGMAWGSGWLADHFGGRRTVTAGLLLLLVGSALRGVWASAVPLYVFTGVFSLGVAVSQTSAPVLVRQWFPARIGLASALYTDGLIAGEALSAGVTLPLMRLWLGPDAWRATFIVWSVPVALTVVLWVALAPASARTPRGRFAAPASRSDDVDVDSHRSGRPVSALQLGLLSGSGSLIYFTMNTWIPPYNAATGHGAATAPVLGMLNGIQLPVCLGMTLVAQRLLGRRIPFMLAGATCLVGLAGWLTSPASWQVAWVALVGGGGVSVLVLSNALPPLLAKPGEVARLAGATLSIGYGLAFVGPLAGGWLWDRTGHPAAAFVPVVFGTLGLMVFGATLPRSPSLPEEVSSSPVRAIPERP
ncbi:MAG TPA: MFS transporter [Thermomicrobiaceae bacterium]|nr:MFS transporter [Thermomicrobiaceae bacterium]